MAAVVGTGSVVATTEAPRVSIVVGAAVERGAGRVVVSATVNVVAITGWVVVVDGNTGSTNSRSLGRVVVVGDGGAVDVVDVVGLATVVVGSATVVVVVIGGTTGAATVVVVVVIGGTTGAATATLAVEAALSIRGPVGGVPLAIAEFVIKPVSASAAVTV